GAPMMERQEHLEKSLRKSTDISSRREKVAAEAERESVKIKQAEYMENRIGEEFDGVISGVVATGAFVELADTLIEGMIPVSAMRDDYYVFDPERRQLVGRKTRKTVTLGARVRVRVTRADRRLRHIDFELVEADFRVQEKTGGRFSGKTTITGRAGSGGRRVGSGAPSVGREGKKRSGGFFPGGAGRGSASGKPSRRRR
ncbi:MAG: S1 RNA-binding domain-containing protein, partial [candidate division Zixibacteria bacterium]|nr:S1 RNA-binding domain-containing protein [candidate division Zixibacteria bacterium]